MDYRNYLQLRPYKQEKEEKKKILSERIRELTCLHMENCPEYNKMMRVSNFAEEGGIDRRRIFHYSKSYENRSEAS